MSASEDSGELVGHIFKGAAFALGAAATAYVLRRLFGVGSDVVVVVQREDEVDAAGETSP